MKFFPFGHIRNIPQRWLGAIGLVCGVVLLTGCNQSGQGRVTLTFPHVLNTEHPVHKAIERFALEVDRASQSSIQIRIFPGGTMGSEQELVDNVAAGTNDFTKISTTILETKTELAKTYSLPYLWRSKDHMWKVLNGDIGTELLDMAIDKGLKGICYFDAGFRSFYTKEPVNNPDDLSGKKIRVQKSEMMTRLVSALGALPQPIAFSELYTALDTGVVDGAENNIPSYYTTRHYMVAPYFVYDEHVGIPDIVVMNVDSWNSLSPEQQQIITDAAHSATQFQRKLWADKMAEYVETMKKEKVTFIETDKQPFTEKTLSIYDDFAGTPVMEYVERIRSVE